MPTRENPSSDARAAHILESLADPLVAFDREYRYTYISKRAAEILGQTPEELLGRCMWDLLPGDRDTGFQEACRRAWAEGRPVTVERYSREMGRWVENFIYPFGDEACTQWRDITQRKLEQEALRHSGERLRFAQRAGGSGTFDWEIPSNVNLWSEELLALYGFRGGEFGGTLQDWEACLLPEDRERTMAVLRKSLETGAYDVEFRIRRHDTGEVRWMFGRGEVTFDAAGRPVRMLGINVDITDRKLAEQARQESEERFRTLADNMSQLAWMTDAAGGIIWYNRRWYEYTGTTLEDVRGWGWRKLHHPQHVKRVVARIRHSFETGEPWEDTFPLRGRDGQYRWFLSRALPVRDSEGRLLRWFGTNTDITEHLQTEDRLRESERRYRGLFESLPEGIMVGEILCDAENRPVDWRYREMNPAAAAMIGRDPAELIGKRVRELFPHSDWDEWVRVFGAVALSGKPGRLEGYGPLSGRYLELLLNSPSPGVFSAVITDVTERRREREWMRVTLASITDAVLATDGEGKVAFLNRMAAELAGWSEEDAVGRPAAEVLWLLDEQSRRPSKNLAAHVLAEGRPAALAAPAVLLARDGREVAVEESAAPIRDSDGKVIGAVLVLRDVTTQRRDAQALREREEQFRTLANALPQLCWMADAGGRLHWFNQRWYDYTGATPAEMEGSGWQKMHHPELLPGIMERWQATLSTCEPFDMILPLRGADSIFRPFLTRVMPVRDEQGNVLRWVGTHTDIGEQIRTEEALRRGEERFRALVMATSEIMYRMGPDWTEMRRLEGRGFLADSMQPNRTWLEEYIPGDERARVQEAISRAIRQKTMFELEHRVVRRDGTAGWAFSRAVPVLRPDGEIEEWFGVASDITERKDAEAALRASEARERARSAELQAVLEAAPVALFVAQDAECRTVMGSRMTYEMLRLEPGAHVPGWSPRFRAMRDGRDIPAEELPVHKAASTGQAVRNYEFDVVFQDGTSRHMLGDAVPLFDDAGRPRGSVGAFVDISERKRNEERLRQTQKLESIGLLAGGIAHDFNNLLTGIMGNASLVLDEVPPGPAERIKEVVAAAERAAHLTRQLLAYSGKGQFVVRDLDVSQAVQEIGDLVQFSLPKSVQLAVTVEKRLPLVRMDPGQLQQILMNLVINAGEALGEGNPGRITVATSMRDIEREFVDAAGGLTPAGRYVCVEIGDTGSGIDAEARPKIFDPFFTTKFTGRGLGLAAVAGIVRSLSGGITVDTAVGYGTTFRVFLPAAEARGQEAEAQGDVAGRATVLVVDDERSVRDFIAAVLRKQGYRVLTASDGREALALCQQPGTEIDAAVLDIVMPLMGANELLPAMKELRPNMRVLLTSGYSESEARRLCAAYPGADFIQKPYTAQQISRAITEMLEARNL
ncbi:MAG TPA: PAS domain S-box protein [Candidatus Limnocylindrales bacterium]|nr:PAS domain S-box protein [Candidatus Limnocylindrales bacterium]